MSRWPDIVHYSWPPDASTGDYIWLNVSLTHWMTKCQDGLTLYYFCNTRCLYWEYIWLNVSLNQRMTTCQDEPDIVLFLVTRCLYWRLHLTECQLDPRGWPNIKMIWQYHSCPPVASTGGRSDWISAWPKGWTNIKMTWYSTTLGHEIPLPWRRYVWLNISLTPPGWTKYQNDLTCSTAFLAMRCLNWRRIYLTEC